MADGASIEARWLSALQLVGLPGLPSTERNIRARAERDGWISRQRAGRGGGREYAESSLPLDARRELARRSAIAAANRSADHFAEGQHVARRVDVVERVEKAAMKRNWENGTARAAGLTGVARERMNAKLDVLARVQEFATHQGLGICAARESFCAALAAGQITLTDVAEQLLGAEISPASIGRWQRTLASQGAAALAGEYGNRKGCGAIESQQPLRDFVLGLLTDKPHLTAKNIHLALCARFGSTALKMPTVRTTARFLERFKADNRQLFTAISNPDAWKNRHMSAFGSASEDVTRLNQRWEFDSTPTDVMLVDGRHTIVQIVDIWSRRRLFHVSKTSSSDAVSQALRRALIAWGIPEQAKVDNGRDYVSERTTRSFAALGVEMLVSPPFQPWKKPHVESGFRTFSHSLLEMLPNYLGHDVADQQAVRASKSFAERMFKKNAVVDIKLSARELQDFCDRWCKDFYEHEPRQGLNGMTVFAKVASWTGEVRRIENERVLDQLLAQAPDGDGGRTVTKKGIRVDKLTYIAAELHGMVGERVQVMYDEQDVGRIVVYHDGEFVCVAECPEVLGISRAEIAAEANRQRKAGIDAKRAEMRKLKREANTTNIAWEILDAKQRENASLAALPLADNVIEFTPAIVAAQRAVDALDAVDQVSSAAPDMTPEKLTAEIRYFEQQEADRVASGDTSKERFNQCLGYLLIAERDRGEFIQRWLDTYTDSPEFKGQWMVFESFGSAAGFDEKFSALLPDGSHYEHYQATLSRNLQLKNKGA
jgi:putative transposase